MYLFYTQFITGLQAGLIPAIIILKKLKLKFIHEIFFDHQEKLEFGVGRAPIQVATIIPGLGHQMQSWVIWYEIKLLMVGNKHGMNYDVLSYFWLLDIHSVLKFF